MEFAEVYENYFSKIYNYIFYRVLHKQITEDIVSTVFLKAAEKFQTYNPDKAGVSTWLFKIAENTLYDYFRCSRAVPVSLDDISDDIRVSVDFDEQTQLIKNEDRRELYNALSELDGKTRDIISQKYFLEKTLRQIAKDKNMNENTVSTLHKRGLSVLRKTMGARI